MARHRIEAPVHAVAEVHIGNAWRPEKILRPWREPGGSMARGVVRPEIRLGLDDSPTRAALPRIVLEDRAQKRTRHQSRGPAEKRDR